MGGESEKLIDCIIRSRGEGGEEELLGGMVFVGRWNVGGGGNRVSNYVRGICGDLIMDL